MSNPKASSCENASPSDPIPSLEEAIQQVKEKLVARLEVEPCDSDLKPCRANWPTDPDSWCVGCLMHTAAEQLTAIQGERDAAMANFLKANHQTFMAMKDTKEVDAENQKLRQRAESAEAELSTVREALRKLLVEVVGIVGFAEAGIREAIGNANLNVLKLRADEGRAALQPSKEEK